MNNKRVMRNHIGNINRAAGTAGGTRYEFILSQDDLLRAYFESHKDLNYNLRKESKRDRFIMNTPAMQQEINKICGNAIQKASKELAELVAADARNEVERQINAALGGSAATTSKNNSSRSTSALSNAIVGGLMSGIGGIINDMFESEDY